MKELDRILDPMEPPEALAALAPHLKKLLAHLDGEALVGFVTGLMQEGEGDKLSSMVNL